MIVSFVVSDSLGRGSHARRAAEVADIFIPLARNENSAMTVGGALGGEGRFAKQSLAGRIPKQSLGTTEGGRQGGAWGGQGGGAIIRGWDLMEMFWRFWPRADEESGPGGGGLSSLRC